MWVTVSSLMTTSWATCSGKMASSSIVSSMITDGWRMLLSLLMTCCSLLKSVWKNPLDTFSIWAWCQLVCNHKVRKTTLHFLHTSLVGVVYLSFGPEATNLLIQLIGLSEKCRNKHGLKVGWVEEHRNIFPEPTLGWGDTLIAGVCINKSAENSVTPWSVGERVF